MKRWAPITYREFYDIPRIFLLESGDRIFLFDCRFNSDKDDYEDTYKVYLMPKLGEKELAASWENLSGKAVNLLGEIRTSAIEFDPTLRQQVNVEPLSQLGL